MMQAARQKALWISLTAAAGSAAAVALYQWKKNSSRRRRAWNRSPSQDRSQLAPWRFDHRFSTLPSGRTLRIELTSPAVVHWTVDQWDTAGDTRTTEVEPGVHVADLPTQDLPNNTRVLFTFFWPEANRWEGEDFEIKVQELAAYYAT